MTTNQFCRCLRLLADGINERQLIRDAWAFWSQIDEEQRQRLICAPGADGERVRLWSHAWDGGMQGILDHVEILEYKLNAATRSEVPS